MGIQHRQIPGGRMQFWSMPQITANTLKIIGTFLMALYFFSAAVIQNGVLQVSGYTAGQLNELLATDSKMMFWAGLGSIASVIGIIAVPIFAWLLVQGVQNTSSMWRYVLRIFLLAVVSEIPYDLALTGRLFDPGEQNSLFTAVIALIMLWLMKIFQGEGLASLVFDLAFTAAGCFWAIFLHCKFGGGFILITAILFLMREHKAASYWLGALISLIYATAPLGFIPMALCNGEHRPMKPRVQYAFYAFYPFMLLVFAAWAKFMRG